jgi:histidinol dehydrogenase
VTGEGREKLAGTVVRLAGYEGFAAHALAVTRRQ